MPKAVISNRIYLNAEGDFRKQLDETLTFKFERYGGGNQKSFEVKKLTKIVNDKVLSIPFGCKHLIPEDYELVYKTNDCPVTFPEFKATLREDQEEIRAEAVELGSCLINARPGWGKTFCAIRIATDLKQKTLIIVHNLQLMDQWVEEVEKTIGITPGRIGGGKKELKDHNIVVGMYQTLRNMGNEIIREFGTVIVDEVHKSAAASYDTILNSISAKNKIGLSGTLERSDGKHVLIPKYFSNKVLIAPDANTMTPEVHIYYPKDIALPGNTMVPWANRINELCENPMFIDLVASLADRYADAGHRVLALSNRVEFLNKCKEITDNKSEIIVGTTKDRKEIFQKLRADDSIAILYGSDSIFKEGISENYLSCLILGLQTKNLPGIHQMVGRVVRIQEGKMTPVIVDIVLEGETAKRQARDREGYYIKSGYKIQKIPC